MKTPLRVLIAEDNPADAELLVRELRRADFEPEAERVDTEAEFRARLRPELDIILSDFMMPQFSGLHALDVLQECGLDIPFILISGTIGEETAVAAMQRGATDYLLKDRLARFGSAVKHALKEGRGRRERREAEAALRASEERFRESARTQIAILNALPAHIALLDPQGVIVAVNEAWRGFSATNALQGADATVGQNYLEICERAHGECAGEAQAVAAGIRRVLLGEAADFSLEYPCHSPAEERWFRLMVTPLDAALRSGAVVTHLDITAQRQAQKALRVQADMLDHIGQAVIATTMDGKVIYANHAAHELYGWPPAEILGRNIMDVTVPQVSRAQGTEIMARLLRGETWHGEFLVQHRNGRVFLAQVTDSPLLDDTGRMIGIVGISADISARKQAEEAVWLFRNLVDQSSDTFEVIDPITGHFLDVNANGPAELGCSREEYLALRVFDIDPTLNAVTWAQTANLIRTNGTLSGEGLHRRRDGTVFPIEFNARWVRLDRDYIVTVVRNITERKRTEARFRRLVDSNAHGVMFRKTSGQITEANDAFLDIVGYRREDLEAGRLNLIALTPPEYASADQRSVEEIAARGVCTPYEKEYFRRDGTRVPVLIGAANFEDNPEEGVAFVVDLTERKKLEQQFLRAQRMESIGTLAGGIAHDLNNTLAPVIMSLDLLKMKFNDPASQELLDIIGTSAQRGADMVRQVLSFARGVEGCRMEVQIRHLLRDIEKIAGDTFSKDISVRTIVRPQLWTVIGDPTQIHQVLLNLCVNARDAMPHGGTLTISAENLKLDAHYAAMNPETRPGLYVFLKVEDSGIGMSPEVMAQIFDPFFTTKELGKGTGLGLPTSLGIVRSHGGFIRVSSELGKGTTFKVYLPAETEISPATAAEPAEETPRGNGELILVVDDETSVQQITQQTLEAFGYRVVLAANGAEALAVYAMRGSEVAVVVTDMMMPVMDGPAMIETLRQMDAAVRVIGVSGLSVNGQVAHAANLGVKHFLPKPYTAETLLKTLKQVLSTER